MSTRDDRNNYSILPAQTDSDPDCISVFQQRNLIYLDGVSAKRTFVAFRVEGPSSVLRRITETVKGRSEGRKDAEEPSVTGHVLDKRLRVGAEGFEGALQQRQVSVTKVWSARLTPPLRFGSLSSFSGSNVVSGGRRPQPSTQRPPVDHGRDDLYRSQPRLRSHRE